MIAKLADLVRPTVWKLGIRTWWGGVFAVEVADVRYPEDALEAYERSGQECDRVCEMSFFCPTEQRWKVLADRDVQDAIVLVRGVK